MKADGLSHSIRKAVTAVKTDSGTPICTIFNERALFLVVQIRSVSALLYAVPILNPE